jgi:hypothetical protein
MIRITGNNISLPGIDMIVYFHMIYVETKLFLRRRVIGIFLFTLHYSVLVNVSVTWTMLQSTVALSDLFFSASFLTILCVSEVEPLITDTLI